MRIGRMGKKDDGNSVVDTHGRVFGVKSLRVVDASSFYLTPPGHIVATVCEYTICLQQKGSIQKVRDADTVSTMQMRWQRNMRTISRMDDKSESKMSVRSFE